MALKNTNETYGWFAKLLHWSVAVLIVTIIWIGLTFADMPRGPEKAELGVLHKSAALLTLMLMVVRLVWRLVNSRPDDPPGTSGLQNAAALWAHRLLYAAVFFQLAVGILVGGQRAIPFFGLFEIPAFLEENSEQHDMLEKWHEAGWIMIASLVLVHVIAALYHHFRMKDNVLKRITTG